MQHLPLPNRHQTWGGRRQTRPALAARCLGLLMLGVCVGCAVPATHPAATSRVGNSRRCCPEHPLYALGPPDACRAGYHTTVWKELVPGYHQLYDGPYGEPTVANDPYEQLPPGIVVPDEPHSDDSQYPSELPEGSEEPTPESSQGTLPPPGFPIEDASYDPFDE